MDGVWTARKVKRRVRHGGGIHGFITNISRVPEDDICIVLLSNASNPTLGEITKSIFAILYGKEYELPKERIAIKLPEEKLKEYEGEYEIRKDLHVIISVKGWRTGSSSNRSENRHPVCRKRRSFFFEIRGYTGRIYKK